MRKDPGRTVAYEKQRKIRKEGSMSARVHSIPEAHPVPRRRLYTKQTENP